MHAKDLSAFPVFGNRNDHRCGCPGLLLQLRALALRGDAEVPADALDDRPLAIACVSLLVVLSFLMVSTFRYWSFKNVDLRSRRSYVMIVGIAVSLILVALHTEWILLLLATAFWLSGPLAFLVGAVRRRPAAAAAVAQSESS